MAIAGRVAIVPKGKWSESVTYDKLDLVTHNGNAFIAYKSSVGVEPVDGDTWMLVMEGVSSDDVENLKTDVESIINGTTAVGNALQLGGKGASEYALAEELTKRPLHFKSLTSATEANSYINDYSANIKDDTAYEFEVNITFSNYELTTGVWHISGTKISSLYEIQTAKNYSGSSDADRVITVNRAKVNGTWSTWVENATIADLANYLPLGGGSMDSPLTTPIVINSTSASTMIVLHFLKSGISQGQLGFDGVNNPIFRTVDGDNRTLLHTGNKPTGTYTGNGTSYQSVVVGGTGEFVMVSTDGSGTKSDFVIVSQNGYFGKVGGAVVQGGNMYTTSGGSLIIDGVTAFLTSGKQYRYQRL